MYAVVVTNFCTIFFPFFLFFRLLEIDELFEENAIYLNKSNGSNIQVEKCWYR